MHRKARDEPKEKSRQKSREEKKDDQGAKTERKKRE
jgi:hypothetical protein